MACVQNACVGPVGTTSTSTHHDPAPKAVLVKTSVAIVAPAGDVRTTRVAVLGGGGQAHQRSTRAEGTLSVHNGNRCAVDHL